MTTVSITTLLMNISGRELGESLKSLCLGRSGRLLPTCFPGFMGRKELASLEVRNAKAIVLWRAETVEFFQRQPVQFVPRERAAQLITRPPALAWLRFLCHAQSPSLCTLP